MKFNVAAAAASAAFLAGAVNAEDQKVLKDESSSVAEPAATQAAPELPTFTVSVPSACAASLAVGWNANENGRGNPQMGRTAY